MNWKTEKPTEPGWYWMYGYEWGQSVAYIYSSNKELLICYALDDDSPKEIGYIPFYKFVEYYDITNFMGPLSVPEPPKGGT